ncbi:hypothetical protein CJ030_MR8G004401 [Morella rubra]|uniref:Uncharacterized protein n=1 Tax=Morella rubra TaxID=262757 RepID=A0A6A1URH9_9ROSI|nr:hypothetical protein CJ030_MR8G004401 [Morella rubra]
MALFESYIFHEFPTHILIIHARVLVSEDLDMIMDHQPYLVLKDPPPNVLTVPQYMTNPSRQNRADLNWVDLTLTDNED